MSDQTVKPIRGESRANTLIVADPDVLTRMVIADYLRECGYRVVECPNAEDVLIILSAGRKIDAVLCEVELGDGLNGFGLAHQVKETHPAVDVLLTSGPVAAANRAGQLCEEGPLERPYHPGDVVRRLNRLRERRRRTQS
jgi:DNA-binding NtrC family response regulator